MLFCMSLTISIPDDVAAVLGSSLEEREQNAREAIALELYREGKISLPEIGSNFGGRDHTTVLHACRQIAKLRESVPEMTHDVNFLLQVLRN